MYFMKFICRPLKKNSCDMYTNFKGICNTDKIKSTMITTNLRLLSNYCLENVKRYDYEIFLATLLLPSQSRDSGFAIRAFNVELALIREIAKEDVTAKMRFQFWRESIDQIYQNKPPAHPVAKALFVAKTKHNLSKKWLKNMIDAREDNMANYPFSSGETLEAYSEKSNSSIYYLILQSLGINDLNVDHAASHLGKSEGIAKLIRGVPHLGSKRIVLIPTTVMATHKVSQQDIIRGKNDQKVKDVIFELASTAYQHLNHAKQLEKDVPSIVRGAFLPAVSVSQYLDRLQLQDFDVFHPKLQRKNATLPLRLLWARIRNSYR